MPTTYIAVDVETTGLDPQRDAIIEVAAVTFRGDEIVDEWSSLVNPHRSLSPFISQLTGITQPMVDEAPAMFSLRPQLKRLLADHVIVGHNVGFDMGFLEAERLALGQHRVDSLTMASILLPNLGRYSLDALVNTLRLPNPAGKQTHRALGDAHQTVSLFLELRRRALELEFETLNEIVQSGRKLGWPETIFFEDVLRLAGRDAFGAQTGGRPKRLFKPEKPSGRALVAAEKPQPLDVETIAALLKPGGNLSRHFPGFEHRPQQVEMLAAVCDAFNEAQHLVVEAGTGTGKSLGYLLPAAFWANQNGRRVVISTNTINLQDQLIHKDLPELQRALSFEVRAAVLKGKSNYLCTRLFQQMRHSGPSSADEMAVYARLLIWLPQSQTGDVAEMTLRSLGERLAWARLNAENDGCTFDKCLEEGCPLHTARRRAELAHILIVNHALLLADVASDNRVLPEYVDLIIDEAHHLEAAVTDGLSFRADKRFLENLLEEITRPRAGLIADLQARVRAAAPMEVSDLIDSQANRLRQEAALAETRVEEFFMSIDYFARDFVNRRSQYAQQIRLVPAMRTQPAFSEVELSWDNLDKHLRVLSEGIGKAAGTLADISETCEVEDGEDLRLALQSNGRHLEETRLNLNALVANPSDEMIYWIESYKERTSLHAAPLHVGPLVEKHIFNAKETVVLTSATLRTAAPNGNGEASFAYLRDRLHAREVTELAVGSPFDYPNCTLVYLPTDIPEPNQPGYQRYVEQAIVQVAQALGGRTMTLFTSYSQLLATARAIEQPLVDAGILLLAQGEGSSRQQLMDQFKQEGCRAVLLGTRSFWEGVDVPGPALQAVLITKFPFDVPSDPIFAARSETFNSPFFEYSVPEAVLRFRQGFGRLIRRQSDEGVVVILDKRAMTKRYGQLFLDALPGCTVVRQRIERVGEVTLRWLNREK
jgi:ATP-dependent DNA helicase DinG